MDNLRQPQTQNQAIQQNITRTDEPQKIHYTYDQIHTNCVHSADIIKKSFNPEVILAIGGGGLIPARMIRSKIDLPIYVVSLSTYDENNTPVDTPRIVQWMDFTALRNKRILIVDEVDDTRKTLGFLTNKLVNEEGINKANLGVFVIHNKMKQKHTSLEELNVYYYHPGIMIEDKWIVYPWE
jgi:hypoxanthine phosphoribosyltransferase